MLAGLPAGAHVLLIAHDHAEDVAPCDAVPHTPKLAYMDLIGLAGEQAHFERKLTDDGQPPEAIALNRTPIGLPCISGADLATIGVAVAAERLSDISQERVALASQQPLR